MRETTKARALFESFINKYEAYDEQICVCTNTFRRNLMIPILIRMKELEKKTDE